MRFVSRIGCRAARAAIAGLAFAALGLACGDDDPTQVGSALRTAPDTLYALDVTTLLEDSVFALPVSLRSSPVGAVGRQGAYTSQILYDFRVPSFVVDEGETLQLDTGRFSVDLTQVSSPPFTGSMRLGMSEVVPQARIWSTSAVYDSIVLERLPELRTAVVAGEDTVSGSDFLATDPKLSVDILVRELADYDSVVARHETLEVNVALLFRGFVEGGPGFVNFQQVTAVLAPLPRFIGVYTSGTTTGTENAVAPARQLVVAEFDSIYSTGPHWVVSDAHRFHTFCEFPDLDDLRHLLPAQAFVQRADLILTQAARGDSTFGIGPNVGVVVPSNAVLDDSTLVYTESENSRALAFQTDEIPYTDVPPIGPAPGGQVLIAVTEYLFDQQEGTVKNRGMILRLSNEGSRARHFEYYGPTAPDPSTRPRLRIVYGLPADFGEDTP